MKAAQAFPESIEKWESGGCLRKCPFLHQGVGTGQRYATL